jgi:thiol-disulfide isomerase/thioredoxin
VLAVVGVLALAALFAVVATSGDEPTSDATPVAGTVTVSGEALPALEGDPDPAVGMAAPSLTGEDFDGSPISIGADGRAKAIVFLAHWCPHCQAEVPVIQEWLDANGMPEDVDLYSVATSIDPAQPNYPPDAWLQREGWTVPVLVDDQEDTAAQAYGLTVFPFFVFVDVEGNVTARATGELPVEELESYLADAAG